MDDISLLFGIDSEMTDDTGITLSFDALDPFSTDDFGFSFPFNENCGEQGTTLGGSMGTSKKNWYAIAGDGSNTGKCLNRGGPNIDYSKKVAARIQLYIKAPIDLSCDHYFFFGSDFSSPTFKHIGWRVGDNGSGGARVMASTADGSTEQITEVGGADFNNTTKDYLILYYPGDHADFFIDGDLVATHTLLPSGIATRSWAFSAHSATGAPRECSVNMIAMANTHV